MANKAWQIWQNTPFSWWQCQLNFSLWCASAGCGNSFEDHLQAEKPLLASLYRFHVYHTTRRLLEELRVALPGDKSYSWYENAYDSRAYKRLCAEFAIPPEQDWRQKLDHGCQGLGSWSTFITPSVAYRHAHVAQGPFFHPRDAMRHNRDISGAWTTFVLDKSEDFTQVGVERLNDSIRTYVWAILGAQAQTLSNILKSRKETPQKLTQLSSRSHPRHLVGKRTAQKDTIVDITSDSQVNNNFPYRWSPASLTFNNYFYLFLYLYIT